MIVGVPRQNCEPHLVRGISNIRSIEVLGDDGGDEGTALSVVSDEGQTLFVLESVKEVH